MKIIKSLQESGLMIKVVRETIKDGTKEQKSVFLRMLLSTLTATLLGKILGRKGVTRSIEETIRAGQDF